MVDGVEGVDVAKAPIDIRSLARSHAPEAIATLAGIMRACVDFPMARIAAANSLLDRGFGKPKTDADGAEHLNITIRKILEGGAITIVTEAAPSSQVIEHDPTEGNGYERTNGSGDER